MVEAVVGAVPEAVARVDGGAGGWVFGEGVLDFPDLEVGFAEEGGGVAGFVEGVAEDGDVLGEVDFVLEDLVAALAAAGDHAGAGGHADGGGGVGAGEADAAGGKGVEMGGANGGVAGAAEGVPALLVGGDEKEVGGLGHGNSLRGEAVGVEGGVGEFEVEADALADEGLEVLTVPGDGDVDAIGDLGVAVGM